jgi:acetate kinase
MSGLGIAVDPVRNNAPVEGPVDVAADDSRVRVLVVPTNEEWEIARQSLEVAGSAG